VSWKGQEVPIAEIEKHAPPAARTAAAWLPLAAAANYRLVLSDDRQVLLVLNARYERRSARTERPDVKKLLALVDTTIAVTDALLGRQDEDAPPAVVVAALGPDYERILAQVATIDPRLRSWAATSARSVTGFALSEPLVAAWLDDGVGQGEWDPLNELVHRTTQLLARRRAPQLPPWFVLGLAWHVEDSVRGGIYCFPHRDGFVWAAEHGDWGKRLASEFKPSRRKSAELPAVLSIEEIAGWDPMQDPGEFDTSRACVAFGIVRYLASSNPESVGTVARAFDEAIRDGWKVTISEIEWTTDPNYRLPAGRQLEILESVDPDFLTHVTDAFVRKKLGQGRVPPRSH
jgi:hypothetical protein